VTTAGHLPYGPRPKGLGTPGLVRTAAPIRGRELAPRFLASLRRLGVDEATLQVVTGKAKRQR
jgi:hypothetical protein